MQARPSKGGQGILLALSSIALVLIIAALPIPASITPYAVLAVIIAIMAYLAKRY